MNDFPVKIKRDRPVRQKAEPILDGCDKRSVTEIIYSTMKSAPRAGQYIEAWSITYDCWIAVHWMEVPEYEGATPNTWVHKASMQCWKSENFSHWRWPSRPPGPII